MARPTWLTTGTYVAAVAFALITASCGGSAQSYLQKGDNYFNAGKFSDAAVNYRKAVQKNPKLGEAYYGLGRADVEKKDPEAYQALTKASELLPHRIDVKAKLADLMLGVYESNPGNGKVYSALTKLTDEMLSLDPNSYDGLRMKGNLALLDRKPEQAIQSFQRANEIRPLRDYLVMGYTQALIQAGRAPEAERLARQLIEKRKDFGPIYDVLFQYYLSTGNAAAAEDVLRMKARNNPTDSTALIQLASYYRQAQKPTAMQSALDELLQNYATRKDAFLAVGDFYAHFAEWGAAASTYEKGSQVQPGEAVSFKKRLAGVRIAQERPAEALEILDQVLAKTPADQEAEVTKAGLLTQRSKPGDIDKAIAIYQTVLKARSSDATAALGLGKAYYAKRDLIAARRALQSAAKSDPVAEEPKTLLAAISMEEGKPADALATLNEVLRVSPASARGRYLKINALIMLGRYDEARPELDRLSREYPQSNDLNLLQGLLAILSKRYQDAETIFSKSGSGNSDVRLAGGLAEAYVGRRQFDKALQILDAEARKSPQQLVIGRMLAKTALRAGQPDRAITELQELLQKQPNSATLSTDLGQAYQAKGDLPKAAEEFQKAIQQGPKDDPLPYFLLGFTLSASGKASAAIQNYRQVLALRPSDSLTMNNLAYVLANNGDPKDLDEALHLAQRALQMNPTEPNFRGTMGWIWLKKGNSDEALQIFTQLCRDVPANSTYQYHLGLALLAKGNKKAAERSLETALSSSPSQMEADEIKGALRRASSPR